MSQYGNYQNLNYKDWNHQFKINKIRKEIKYLRRITLFCLGFAFGTILLNNYKDYKQENRLNEHKRLLIAQQEQINKLILNAEYNKDYKQENRLNEHKRLLIAQQEQINKLILNAEYNKLRYEQIKNK